MVVADKVESDVTLEGPARRSLIRSDRFDEARIDGAVCTMDLIVDKALRGIVLSTL